MEKKELKKSEVAVHYHGKKLVVSSLRISWIKEHFFNNFIHQLVIR